MLNQIILSGEAWHILSIIVAFLGVLYFIITVIRLLLNYRLKIKMIEKGLDEELIRKLLGNGAAKGMPALKWFSLLAGLGLGVLIISFTLPLGIHSLAILFLSLSLSFLGYYYAGRNDADR